MRVAHVTPYYPPHLGGMEHVARRIAEETAAAGVEVSVLTSALPGGIPKREEKTPVTRCAAVEVGHTPVMPGLLPRLLTIPREAIVHLHVAQPLVPELVRAAAAIRGFLFLRTFTSTSAPPARSGGYCLSTRDSSWDPSSGRPPRWSSIPPAMSP